MAPTNGMDEDKAASGSMLIVVMGVSGTGKSTLGAALASELGLPYIEGDDLHPQANVDKMSNGIPLNDADRQPWLELIRTTAESHLVEQQAKSIPGDGKRLHGVVVTCSALKRTYRDIIRGRSKPASSSDPSTLPSHLQSQPAEVFPTYFVFIDGPREVLYERMEKRPGHFFKASMLDSQLATLEQPREDEGVIVVSIESSTEDQVKRAKEQLIELGRLFVDREL
ncbi:gluconokinase [Coprinopsis sp. MPI-PUGE-AT-0042]|nr:gluconokinase [Coprinopsis sp. MPI-PUGE-AT-0042]